MNYPPLKLALVVIASLVQATACSSKYGNGGTKTSSTGGTSGGVTSGGSAGTSSAVTDGGSGGTSTSGAVTSGGSGGSSADGSGAAAGASDTGGSGGTGGSAGTGTGGSAGSAGTGGSPIVMYCDPEDPDCACDALGCFLVPGAECTQGTDCKTQICGVTQDANNVCCAEGCDETQVCAADGTSCETAAACDDELERCSAEGDHQRCTGGQWDTVTECNGRGCSLELTGGCLSPLGVACVASEECGQGSCQETADDNFVCCEASCGDCQVCNPEGTGCEEPPEVKPGCDCTEADASNCNDNVPCTVDTCDEGRCSNELESGYCLIDGQCYDHNQPEPGNACRYCDAALRDRAWTNSSNTVSCNDDAWCNGEDTCNGTGQCQHDYPTSARCTESGPCALTTCDEARDSCYQPSSFECETVPEDRCKTPSSGAARCPELPVQRRTTSTFCSGTSNACDGATSTSTWGILTACTDGLSCDPDTITCAPLIGCGYAWCDVSTATDLCWTSTDPEPMSFAEAEDYCDQLDFVDHDDWRLPTLDEWLELARGCDDATGQPQPESFESTCTFDGDDDTPCTFSCPTGEGPTDGCYWPTQAGSCSTIQYWSSTVVVDPLSFRATNNWVDPRVSSANGAVRCVTTP